MIPELVSPLQVSTVPPFLPAFSVPRSPLLVDANQPITTNEPVPIPCPRTPSPPQVQVNLIDMDLPIRDQNDTVKDFHESFAPFDAQFPALGPAPCLDPVNDDVWRNLWPEMTAVFKQFMQPPSPQGGIASETKSNIISVDTRTVEAHTFNAGIHSLGPIQEEVRAAEEIGTVTTGSPLAGEPLLRRPVRAEGLGRPNMTHPLIDLGFDFQYGPSNEALSPRAPTSSRIVTPLPAVRLPNTPSQLSLRPDPLRARFICDINIPDGQVFPPGAEFVKSWRMINEGTTDWPELTELVFVAGDRMAPFESSLKTVRVGSVKAGAEVEVVSGEMKVSSKVFEGYDVELNAHHTRLLRFLENM